MSDPALPPVDVFALDQAVIDAGRAFLTALLNNQATPADVDTAREALKAARRARWGHD